MFCELRCLVSSCICLLLFGWTLSTHPLYSFHKRANVLTCLNLQRSQHKNTNTYLCYSEKYPARMVFTDGDIWFLFDYLEILSHASAIWCMVKTFVSVDELSSFEFTLVIDLDEAFDSLQAFDWLHHFFLRKHPHRFRLVHIGLIEEEINQDFIE